MTEAENADIVSYKSFNDFFTRPLKVGARPLAPSDFVCPVDGAISQFGTIDDHYILQAKGHRFTTTELVGGDQALATHFRHGSFANLYLLPEDYHRLHMPCEGTLTRMIYVPGALFSVKPTIARGAPNLFARNEPVVCVFESSQHGPFVMVLVSATIVGSVAIVWHGIVNPRRFNKVSEWTCADQAIVLEKGEEIGRFLLGSTVVMLFQKGTIAFSEGWKPERSAPWRTDGQSPRLSNLQALPSLLRYYLPASTHPRHSGPDFRSLGADGALFRRQSIKAGH